MPIVPTGEDTLLLRAALRPSWIRPKAMSHTTSSTSSHQPSVPPAQAPVPGLRIDDGHLSQAAASRSSATAASDSDESQELADLPAVHDLDRRQLAQLAQRLQQRHTELCRQQEALNAQLAAIEKERRRERMWLQEQKLELADREARLKEQASAASAEQVAELEQRLTQQQLAHRRELDEAREKTMQAERRAQEVEQHWKLRMEEADRAAQRRLDAQQRKLDDYEKAMRAKLAAIEQTLREQSENLQQDRLAWQQRRDAWESRLRARREAWVQRWLRERRRLAHQLESLRQIEERLEQRQAAMERLENDLHQFHADLLQERLVVETATSRLEQSAQGPRAAHLLASLRQRLDEELHWQRVELERQRDELEELANRAEVRGVELAERRQSLLQWLKRRQEDLQTQAEQLAAREEELNRFASEWESKLAAAEQRCARAEAQLRTWVRREYA